jgi:hypothetical protein
VSSTLEADLVHAGTLVALELKDDLAGSLDVLLEDGLGLTTKTGLLTVITTLTLSEERGLTGLLLPSDSVKSVLVALVAVSLLLLGEVDHYRKISLCDFDQEFRFNSQQILNSEF